MRRNTTKTPLFAEKPTKGLEPTANQPKTRRTTKDFRPNKRLSDEQTQRKPVGRSTQDTNGMTNWPKHPSSNRKDNGKQHKDQGKATTNRNGDEVEPDLPPYSRTQSLHSRPGGSYLETVDTFGWKEREDLHFAGGRAIQWNSSAGCQTETLARAANQTAAGTASPRRIALRRLRPRARLSLSGEDGGKRTPEGVAAAKAESENLKKTPVRMETEQSKTTNLFSL